MSTSTLLKTVPNISAKRGPIDLTYLAGLKSEKVAIYAASLAQAKQKAIEHFRPKKKDTGLLWVRLAEVEQSYAE